MAKRTMSSVWYLVMLSVCIDQGDGRWKERDKEDLQHDLDTYKKIAEKLEREIEAFYDEYPNGWLRGDNVERIHSKYLTNLLDRITEVKNTESANKEHTFPFVSADTYVTRTTESATDISTIHNVPNKHKTNDWPTFQEMLLSAGRKYDWKNDRWIKVKEKPRKLINKKNNSEILSNISERHKFSYRIVKVKSKSRRNVVVAVSAVR